MTSILSRPQCVNQPSQSWDMDTGISKFDLEKASSRSQFKVTQWVQHPIVSHPFHSMSTGWALTFLRYGHDLIIVRKDELAPSHYLKPTRTPRTPAFWDTPAAPWFPILVIHIRSQVKSRQSQILKIYKNCQNFKFWNFARNFTRTHFLKLLDKMYKYEMDPTRTVGATERTRDVGRTDGVKPIYPSTTSLYNYDLLSVRFSEIFPCVFTI